MSSKTAAADDVVHHHGSFVIDAAGLGSSPHTQ